ncbi:short-chain fatty acyl-CoA regulator family protein [Pelagibacteraceae bacterium]|nr:short-chain fatty acyl-CoA regulator family protein [Pelagibacteraceae bacterium]
MSQIDIQIGHKIKNTRRRLKITQAELSKKLSISPAYLNLMENGKRKINVDLLLKMANELNIEISDISKKTDTNLYQNLMDLLGDNLFENLDITNFDVKELVNTNPLIAKALVKLGDNYKKKNQDIVSKVENISGKFIDGRKNSFPGEVVADFVQENQNYFPKLEEFASDFFTKIQTNNRVGYSSICEYLLSKHKIEVKDVVPDENKPFTKQYDEIKKIFLVSDYLNLETKKLYAGAQIGQLEAGDIIDEYLNTFSFPSEESKKLSKVALLNYAGAAIIMPYKPFYEECIKQRYDVELLQNTFAVSFEQVAHRITCLQDPKMKGIPFHMLRADVAGNISKRFSLSGIEIPRYGGACPRWNIYKAFTMPGKINAAISKMPNGEKYVCIARTVEKGVGKHGMEKTLLSIGLGCQVKYAKDFVYADSLNLNDKKTETPIGVNCRTCDRMDCQQRAFPPLHKKFDIDLNKRGISVYVAD